jgi:sugar-specific transcriptional regulator TrmB
MDSERDRIVGDLVSYGLTPVQAQVLMALMGMGRSSAKAVASTSEVNRVDVYRALKRLEKLGLVEKVLGSPTTFTAAKPEDALDMLVALRAREVERLRALRSGLGLRLQMLAVMPEIEDDLAEGLFLKVLAGEQAFRRQKALISNSTAEVIKVFSPHSMLLYERIGLPEIESELASQKVTVRGVTGINEENFRNASRYSKAVELRHSDELSSHLRYTIVDRTSLLLPVGEPPASLSDPTALWTNSRTLIAALVDDFEKLWASAVPVEERVAELQRRPL